MIDNRFCYSFLIHKILCQSKTHKMIDKNLTQQKKSCRIPAALEIEWNKIIPQFCFLLL